MTETLVVKSEGPRPILDDLRRLQTWTNGGLTIAGPEAIARIYTDTQATLGGLRPRFNFREFTPGLPDDEPNPVPPDQQRIISVLGQLFMQTVVEDLSPNLLQLNFGTKDRPKPTVRFGLFRPSSKEPWLTEVEANGQMGYRVVFGAPQNWAYGAISKGNVGEDGVLTTPPRGEGALESRVGYSGVVYRLLPGIDPVSEIPLAAQKTNKTPRLMFDIRLRTLVGI